MTSLPLSKCLIAAIATPVTADCSPDVPRLLAHAKALLRDGCNGIALFGTTGEGPEFSVEQRLTALEQVTAQGIAPGQIVVGAGALAIADIVRLARAAADAGTDSILLMPPFMFRNGISAEGTTSFYASVIEQTNRPKLRILLYHFPDISGVSILPEVVSRLIARYPAHILGVKDSGGDLNFTLDLIRRFPQLSMLTGTEVHVPDVIAAGGHGTICGLGNVMPQLMRRMIDMDDPEDQKAAVAQLARGDEIICRKPFIPSVKSVIAYQRGDVEWRRVVPPMSAVAEEDAASIVRDYKAWEAALPAELRPLPP